MQKKKCTRCRSEVIDTQFYKSNSDLNTGDGRLTICRSCISELYSKYLKEYKSEEKSLYRICQMLDTYYDPKLFETSKDKHNETNMTLEIYYFSKIGLSQYKGKDFSHSPMIDIWSKDKVEIKVDTEKKDKREVTKDMIKRWGKNKDIDDYFFLEDTYETMCKTYDTSNPLSMITYAEIAISYLDMRNAESAQEKKQIYETISKMTGDCKIKAAQQDQNSDDAYTDFITMIEFEEPCEKSLPFFEDMDKCEKYFKRFVHNPLSISLELERIESMDDYTEEFDGDGDE